MKTNSYENVFEFLISVPDEILNQIILNDWKNIEALCMALTLDLQVNKEFKQKQLPS